jgi:hypothetical protein
MSSRHVGVFGWGAAVAACAVAFPAASAAAATGVAPCALSGVKHVQLCPVAFEASTGRSTRVVVARYADFSHCDLPAPGNEPGENQNYRVASVTINWGDHSRPTTGVAHTGAGCVPTDSPDTDAGISEPVTGAHKYRRQGTYRVSVTITYVRGAGNTYQNCASAPPGSTTYDNLTNCIALNAPVTSIATVKTRR